MVFWGTVLAFIIGIMYYMMNPADKLKTQYMPASEAFVSGFVAQHQAAKEAARELAVVWNTRDAYENTKKQPFDGKEEAILILSGDGSSFENWLDVFLPLVHTLHTTDEFQPRTPADDTDQYYTSIMVCMDKPEREKAVVSDPSGDKYDRGRLVNCSGEVDEHSEIVEPGVRYVVTYGPVNYSMANAAPYLRNKNLLWEAAISKRTHGNPDCGYLYNAGTDRNEYFVHTYNKVTRHVPSKLIEALRKELNLDGSQSATDYLTENGRRIGVGEGDEFTEMMFCISPINKPYPSKEMLFHYDSILNTGIPKGHDSSRIKWINLFDGPLSDTTGTIEAGRSADVNLSDDHCWSRDKDDGECAVSGDRFGGRSGLRLTAGEAVSLPYTMSDWFKSSGSTLSLYAKFGSGSYSVVSSSCSGTRERPCLQLKHETGRLTLSVTPSSGSSDSSDSVNASIQENTPVQVDVIVSKDGAKLYVDGKEAKNEKEAKKTIKADLTGLSGGEIQLGGSGANMSLYNVQGYWDAFSDKTYEVTRVAPDSDEYTLVVNGKTCGTDCYEDVFAINSLPRIRATNKLRYPTYRRRNK